MAGGSGGSSGTSGTGTATQQDGYYLPPARQQNEALAFGQSAYGSPSGYQGYANPMMQPQAGGAAYSYLAPAADQLSYMTAGPLGMSPGTLAGMQSFEAIQRPQLENQLATMGLGRSGAGAGLMAQQRTAAYAPLVQQEMANRMTAAQQWGNLGQTVGGLENQGLQAMLQAQQLEQQRQQSLINSGILAGGQQQKLAQDVLNAPYQEWLRQGNMLLGLMMPGGNLPQSGTSTSTTSQGGGK